jgi:hypothetical protein
MKNKFFLIFLIFLILISFNFIFVSASIEIGASSNVPFVDISGNGCGPNNFVYSIDFNSQTFQCRAGGNGSSGNLTSNHAALSNLAWNVAGHTINTNFVSIAASSYDLGNGKIPWQDLYLSGYLNDTKGNYCTVEDACAFVNVGETDPIYTSENSTISREGYCPAKQYAVASNSSGLFCSTFSIPSETDPVYTSQNTTIARIGSCPEGYVVQNTTTSGVQCVTTLSTTYYVNSTVTTGGTNTTSNITLMWYYDGETYNITEGSGANPLTVYINYTNITAFSQWVLREYYLGSASHHVVFEIYDYDTGTWEQYFSIVGQEGQTWLQIPVYDSTDHVSGGVVQTRLRHPENGVSSHRLYIDVAWLINGNMVGASTNLDGYAKYNFGYNNFAGNGTFTTSSNITAANFFGYINWSWIQNAPIIPQGFDSRVKAYDGSGTTVNGETQIVLDSELFDGRSEFDTGTYTFTANESGYYQMNAMITYEDPPDEEHLYARIKVAGATYSEGVKFAFKSDNIRRMSVAVSDIAYLNSGDTIELYGDVTTITTTRPGSPYTYLSVHKLS